MSIAKKTSLVVSFLALLLLLGMGAMGLGYHEQQVGDRMREEARLLARLIRVCVEQSLDDYGQMGAIEDLVSRRPSLQLTFFGTDGRAVAPVPTEEKPVVNHRARRVMERDRDEEEVGDGAFAVRTPLHDPQTRQVAGALELRFDLEARGTGPGQTTALLVALGLLVLFALAVGIFSRRAIQRPIAQLMDGMDHVIRGDLTCALPIDRSDEIGRIAYRWNEMTAQLRDAQEQVHGSAEAKLRLEQRLRQSEKLAAIGQLSAEIAHEVGTPLNVIGARARTLLRKAVKPEAVTHNAAIIADQAERITKIIEQMLDLSRARIPTRVPVDLPRILDDALSLLQYQIERQSIVVERTVQGPLPSLMGDPDGLQQVLINLVHNAVQAMPEGGTLTVAVAPEHRRREGLDLAPAQRFVMVSVADTGPGIPEALRSQIFEPFFSTKPRGEGTGLGLTVALGIVKEHDGWVDVGQGVSRGAVLRVYLPSEESSEENDHEKR